MLDKTEKNEIQTVDYDTRARLLLLRPTAVDEICAHIANGGTIVTLADAWGVRFSDISNYMASKPELRTRYDRALIDRTEWECERMLQELRSIATCDIRQAYDAAGRLKPIQDMPANVAAALQSVESEELYDGTGAEREAVGVTKKVKFWDKAKAIELFMKKHGMLVDRHKVEHEIRLEDLVGAANADVVIDVQGDEIVAQPAQLVDETKSSEQNPEEVGVPRGISGV